MANAEFQYLSGFGNHCATEALPGALPEFQNSPQRPPYKLYAEQFSGSAFTEKRAHNVRSWLYRLKPSVGHSAFTSFDVLHWQSAPLPHAELNPTQLRWSKLPAASGERNFVAGITTVAANGNVLQREGSAVHIYDCNKGMDKTYFYNADGEMLLVPQEGHLVLLTEMGRLEIGPKEIAVIPRGVKFQANPVGARAYGYICENYGKRFELPGLGPIGANGLANPRDFQIPTAWFEQRAVQGTLVVKFGGKFFAAACDHSPFDVVAWHGNYAPYKYDLNKFNTINSVSFDHPDPSIFTVLTSPTNTEGLANIDFVIFPPRWMVAENTFRPPYFHRNVMSEYMGLITGVYDAKTGGGFEPGGGSLHNCMSAHGPDASAFDAATNAELKPHYLADTLAFMFESSWIFQVSEAAMKTPALQRDYWQCWSGLKVNFDGKP